MVYLFETVSLCQDTTPWPEHSFVVVNLQCEYLPIMFIDETDGVLIVVGISITETNCCAIHLRVCVVLLLVFLTFNLSLA